MRVRVLVAAVLAAAVAISLPAQAAPKTLDGKKVKKIAFKATPTPQAHDEEFVTGSLGGPDRVRCKPPRCVRVDFVFKPAKGVTGDLVFRIAAANPTTDADLYVIDSKYNTIAQCGAFAGNEAFKVPGKRFKTGKTYTVVVDFYRVISDTITGSIEFPAKYTSKAPAQAGTVDSTGIPVSCGWPQQ